jgi:hypothetical protein
MSYAYFLGWVVLHSKMTAIGLHHELRNLPIMEYLCALAFIASTVGMAVGLAVLGRVFTTRYWFVSQLIPLYFLANLQYLMIKQHTTDNVELAFAYPEVALSLIGLVALFIVACALSDRLLSWLRSRVQWRWGLQAALGTVAAFLTFSEAVGHGVVLGNLIVQNQYSVQVRVSDEVLAEYLAERDLVTLFKIEDRWYFADRAVSKSLGVSPIMVPDSSVLGVASTPDPERYPKHIKAINEYDERRLKRMADKAAKKAKAVTPPPAPPAPAPAPAQPPLQPPAQEQPKEPATPGVSPPPAPAPSPGPGR